MEQPFEKEIKDILRILNINWIDRDKRIDLTRVLGAIYDVGYTTGFEECTDIKQLPIEVENGWE